MTRKRRTTGGRRLVLGLGVLLVSAGLCLGSLELLVRAGVLPLPVVPNPPMFLRDAAEAIRYRNLPGYDGWAFGVPLRVNRLGLRGPEVSETKRPGTFRLLVLGDSIAFGLGLRHEEVFTSVLAGLVEPAEGFERVEVLNAAVIGHNSVQEVALYETYLRRLAPDAVLLLYVHNDTHPATYAGRDHYLYREDPERVGGQVAGTGGGFGGDRLLELRPLRFLRFRSRLYQGLEYRALRWWHTRRAPRTAGAGAAPPAHGAAWLEPADFLAAHERLERPQPAAGSGASRRGELDQAGVRETARSLLGERYGAERLAGWTRARAALRRLAALCEADGIPLGLGVYLGSAAERGRLLALAAELGAPAFNPPDAAGTVDEVYRLKSLGWDSHPNAEVHRAMAASTAWHLARWGWVRSAAPDPRPRQRDSLRRSAAGLLGAQQLLEAAVAELRSAWTAGAEPEGLELLAADGRSLQVLLARPGADGAGRRTLVVELVAPDADVRLGIELDGEPLATRTVRGRTRLELPLDAGRETPSGRVCNVRLHAEMPLRAGEPACGPEPCLGVNQVAFEP